MKARSLHHDFMRSMMPSNRGEPCIIGWITTRDRVAQSYSGISDMVPRLDPFMCDSLLHNANGIFGALPCTNISHNRSKLKSLRKLLLVIPIAKKCGLD